MDDKSGSEFYEALFTDPKVQSSLYIHFPIGNKPVYKCLRWVSALTGEVLREVTVNDDK